MIRIIPKSTKLKFKFYRNITIPDMLLALVSLGFIVLAVTSNLENKFMIATTILMVVCPLYITFENERLYMVLFTMFKYLFSTKKLRKHKLNQLMPYKEVKDNIVINKNNYCFGVVKINPIDLFMLDETRQNYLIDNVLSSAFKTLGQHQNFDIVKLEQPLVLDEYKKNEILRLNKLINAKEKGFINKQEYEEKINVTEERINIIDYINNENRINYSVYYLVVYDTHLKSLQETLISIVNHLNNNGLSCKQLESHELKDFINYSLGNKNSDNTKKIESFYPKKIKFKLLKTIQDKKRLTHFVISDYPLTVGNGWAEDIFNLPNTKVTMKLKPVESHKAIKRVDSSIAEMSGNSFSNKASSNLKQQTHFESLQLLLERLENSNETLYDTTIIITVYDELKSTTNRKEVKKHLRKLGLKFNEMIGKQLDTYFTSTFTTFNGTRISRGINTSAICASFPFISDSVMDNKGLLIGENSLPVFVDFFKRDNERVNSNMVIIGKSGSGKSFATKTLLTHLSSDNAKVFILDPENEYHHLTKNLGGKVLDASSSKDGRINPFHIIASLDDENMDGSKNSFYAHLQFLEEFFRLILVGINSDSLELLNKLILEVYVDKNINAYTNLKELKASDYPIFEDLVNLIEKKLKKEQDDYTMSCLKILNNYLSKFKSGGRNSSLWNGESTFNAKENFVCFNFQKLLSNRNNVIANAQMLLVLKWLDNEIIKNREYNEANNTDRKIIVAIDEAHIFIDENKPVALDFMHQLAKRIRKYNGSLIVVTQNVKDFVGSPEIERKSSAIINVSQYSLIFSLPPNDMNDLVKLYEKAGQINKREQDNIVNLPRGSAFLITAPNKRTNIDIIAMPYVNELFEKQKSQL